MGFDKFSDDIEKAKARVPASQKVAPVEYQKLLMGGDVDVDVDEECCGREECSGDHSTFIPYHKGRRAADGQSYHYMRGSDPNFQYCEYGDDYCDSSAFAIPAFSFIVVVIIVVVFLLTPSFR